MSRDVCEHFVPVDLPCAKCEQTPTLREAAQQALEALVLWAAGRDIDAVALNDLIFRLEAALAEPVQEPVAWMDIDSDGQRLSVRQWSDGNRDEVPLYTAPPQRKPLTEDEIALIVADCSASAHRHDDFSFARAIERAHGIGGRDE